MLALRSTVPPVSAGFIAWLPAAAATPQQAAQITVNSKTNAIVATVVQEHDVLNPQSADHRAHALLGVVRGHAARWLAVVFHGVPQGMGIVRVLEVKLLALACTPTGDDVAYARDVEATLSTGLFFYASAESGMDITQPIQNMYKSSQDAPVGDETNFCFNQSLMRGLEAVPATLMRPIIQGSVACFSAAQGVDFALITRRATENCGARYWTRGLNAAGYAANACETELVLYNNTLKQLWALVIARGSIPLQWSQFPHLNRRPPVVLGSTDESEKRFLVHFDRLKRQYGDGVVAVHLVGTSFADQGELGKQYEALCAKHGIRFVWFDFHHHCKHLPYDAALESLGAQLAASDVGYFLRRGNGVVDHRQRGVVRVNCIDNVDRTSVVQCGITMAAVLAQLARWGTPVRDEAAFKRQWLRAWGRSADHISYAYTGVPHALKGDFYAAEGRQTLRGTLRDALTSMTRYVQNTFFDARRHDVLLSIVRGQPAATSPSRALATLSVVVVVAWAMAWQSGVGRTAVLASCALVFIVMKRGSTALAALVVQKPSLPPASEEL